MLADQKDTLSFVDEFLHNLLISLMFTINLYGLSELLISTGGSKNTCSLKITVMGTFETYEGYNSKKISSLALKLLDLESKQNSDVELAFD